MRDVSDPAVATEYMLGVYDFDLRCNAGDPERYSCIGDVPSVSDLVTERELLLRTWVRDVAGEPGRISAARHEKESAWVKSDS